jgi:microbial collagenase
MLPAGAKNVKVATRGGSGDADLYVALDRYPTVASYDMVSAVQGNAESVSFASPVSGRWYYVMLKAKTGFSGVTAYATYD